jgi:hypothetical protein
MIKLKEDINSLVLRTKDAFDKELFYIDFNQIKFNQLLNFGIVYIIYIENNGVYIPKYIGKSKGKYFKSRLKSHLEGVGVKNGTSSKFYRIINEKNVCFKFIRTEPCSLRNLLEELLIENFSTENHELWNFK